MFLPGANTVFTSATNIQAARETKYQLAEGIAKNKNVKKDIRNIEPKRKANKQKKQNRLQKLLDKL
jgi:hypothetical protein